MSAKTGIAPIGLLDILAGDGSAYHFGTKPIVMDPMLTGTQPSWSSRFHRGYSDFGYNETYQPWLLTAGPFHFSRSMQADVGSFTIQNISGDSVRRDVSDMLINAAFEGALCVFREWNVEAASVEFEFHGRLTVLGIGEDVVELGTEQRFNASNYQAPPDQYNEKCPFAPA